MDEILEKYIEGQTLNEDLQKLRDIKEKNAKNLVTLEGIETAQNINDEGYYMNYRNKAEKVRNKLLKVQQQHFKEKWANATVKLKQQRFIQHQHLVSKINNPQTAKFNDIFFPSNKTLKMKHNQTIKQQMDERDQRKWMSATQNKSNAFASKQGTKQPPLTVTASANIGNSYHINLIKQTSAKNSELSKTNWDTDFFLTKSMAEPAAANLGQGSLTPSYKKGPTQTFYSQLQAPKRSVDSFLPHLQERNSLEPPTGKVKAFMESSNGMETHVRSNYTTLQESASDNKLTPLFRKSV